MELKLPSPCVVILVGPGASGKSAWAAEHFGGELIVSSDRLRALVGAGEDDIAASADAFALLEEVVGQRIRRGLTTVVDTLGLDRERRVRWLAAAREAGMACVAVGFDTPAEECRRRNRERTAKRIPADALTSQLRAWRRVKDELAAEGYDDVLEPAAARVVPTAFVESAAAQARQSEAPVGLRFGLQLSSYTHKGATAEWIREVAGRAEAAGFDAIYVMDHFRQIPQVGRAWEDFLESWTTLGFLAACTTRVRLGTLVSGVTYRNVAHLGKIAATLDVLSGGRAVCGVGLAWFEAEHKAYGWPFPAVSERYALLEDTLQLLPVLWGPGNKPFHGKVLDVPDTTCYPRPLQDHLPLLVGGSGRRTLRLAGRYADAVNVFGDVAAVRERAAYLRQVSSRPLEVTHLSTTLAGKDKNQLDQLIRKLRPRNVNPEKYAATVNAGTVDDQIGRFRELSEAGVTEVMLSLPDLDTIETVADVISAFRV
ncbi:alkanesulfonate monooxygenase SsuD/methylene tetrahydromethanopterin reductase-like flavin-dependent oxidoreductase (luciferase family)/predicted kinase [Kribbella aluminosa]|uniref:Alkanesulfonate monooxygenase SsuD/methylene tetrahydromethanopterin reductase-like flavin-dependent oxidoreductase (Luciferase family)/predicted kinase n=1 Tax=Kribbella aluminosa TaxID=416017 RepID=A0ABS4UE58_9ACTN|nr:LLM class flavin-dependent oxidoreductase [Kribbella aluminosa]MBP2349925.1 alkanesulfonate monooxygenase SsuD/methylene tetrahydromethanopterin reductase-like flavin-dependent oxidoreductase (luciferase family)/predicted kinase [Kribbella aluminosa]